jgi:hypothetical protein
MEDNDTNGYGEYKSIEPQAESKGKISNANKQKAYRNRLKDKVGSAQFKKEQATKMKQYRLKRAESVSVDETKITNKQTRVLVNDLLKSIETRIITMIQEQKQNPIPIHFENHIRPDEIEPILVNINNSMSNEEVVDAFVANELKNPRNARKTAARGTFINYLNNIDIIRRDYFGIKKIGKTVDKVYNDFEFLRDTEGVTKLIKEKYSKNANTYSTTVNSISAILARLNNFRDIYLNTYMPLNVTLTKDKVEAVQNQENTLTDKEKDTFLSWDKILALENKVKHSKDNPVENLVIFYLYTLLPPRRLEYGDLILAYDGEFQDDDKTNYVVISNNKKKVVKIILNKYKTRKTYGKYIIDPIPEKLSKAIIALIKEQDYVDGENLFMSIKAKAYGGGFSGRLKKVFKEATISPENIKGRDITLNTLRHSFISYFVKDNISNKKKNEYAMQMGHSISMQDLYRRITDEEKE